MMVDVLALTLQILHDAGLAWYAELPANVDRPVGRIEDAGGPPQPSTATTDRLTYADLQVTAWGNSLPEAKAHLLAAVEALRVAVRTNPTRSQGTMTRMVPGGLFPLPDEDWPVNGRPGPRYEMTVRTVAHG